MFALRNAQPRPASTLGLALAGAVLLLAASSGLAGDPVYGITPGILPWQRPDYRGYAERTRPAQPPPPVVKAQSQRYTITITVLPQTAEGADPNVAVVMAHLPEDALVWFDDYATKSKGMVRYFESPPLTPGRHYYYTARVVWHEGGEWVS
jgi:uncharacterized protein (TIGR03000 family)